MASYNPPCNINTLCSILRTISVKLLVSRYHDLNWLIRRLTASPTAFLLTKFTNYSAAIQETGDVSCPQQFQLGFIVSPSQLRQDLPSFLFEINSKVLYAQMFLASACIIRVSKTSVTLYHSRPCNTPEDSVHPRSRENLNLTLKPVGEFSGRGLKLTLQDRFKFGSSYNEPKWRSNDTLFCFVKIIKFSLYYYPLWMLKQVCQRNSESQSFLIKIPAENVWAQKERTKRWMKMVRTKESLGPWSCLIFQGH